MHPLLRADILIYTKKNFINTKNKEKNKPRSEISREEKEGKKKYKRLKNSMPCVKKRF